MKTTSAQSGYSLVELVLVIFVAGLIILVLANIVPAMNFINGSSHENVARQIAAKQLEDIRAQGYDNVAKGSSSFSDSRLNTLSHGAGSVIISDCPSNICLNNELIYTVKIQITWIENGKNKIFTIDTLLAKGGIR